MSRETIFELCAGPYSKNELRVVSLRGVEEISKVFSFDVVVLAGDLDELTLEAALLGQRAQLTMNYAQHGRRVVVGVVAELELEGFVVHGLSSHELRYRLRIVPRLWLLGQRVNTRIFEHKRLYEIVDEVLEDADVVRSWRLTRKYPVRAYCVQYQETDLEFVQRLLEEQGIFFYFEHLASPAEWAGAGAVAGALGTALGVAAEVGVPGASAAAKLVGPNDVMILCDGVEGYTSVNLEGDVSPLAAVASAVGFGALGAFLPCPTIPCTDAGGMVRESTAIHKFSLRRTLRSNASYLGDYDFQRPSLVISATAKVGDVSLDVQGLRDVVTRAATGNLDLALDAAKSRLVDEKLEVYEHHGEYEEPDVETNFAHVALEQLRRKVWVGAGESDCCSFLPGAQFRIDDHGVSTLNRQYVVTRVEHEGIIPERADDAGRERVDRVGRVYQNTFQCVPASIPFRPKRPPRRLRQVAETAIVVGPEGTEIHTDSHGRIRVRFHWERESHDSCWIRVAQSWAGATYGTQFIPRVGTEVVVTFLGGDQDRPMVIGSVYNGEHPHPFSVPTKKTRSGIRTSSTPNGAGGFNELSFEDQVGSERVFIHAQANFDEVVKQDHSRTVGRDERVAVTGNQAREVGGRRTAFVEKEDTLKVKGDRTLEVGGALREHVVGGAGLIVDGELSTTVAGVSRENVSSGKVLSVAGSLSESVGGDRDVRVAKDYVVRVDGGHFTSVGSDGEEEPRGAGWLVKGDFVVDASKAIIGKAGTSLNVSSGKSSVVIDDEGIVLRCNKTVFELKGDSLNIQSKKITIYGSDEMTLVGGSAFIKMDGKTELAGDEIKMFAQGASIELSTVADIKGSMVHLQKKSGSKTSVSKSDPKDQDPKKTKLKIIVKDSDGQPLANKKYKLTVDGKRMPDGTTDGSGKVEAEVHHLSQAGVLEVEVGDPKPNLRFPLVFNTLPPIDEVAGAKARLRNLGLYQGTIDDTFDRELLRALKAFQTKNDLEVTGRIDDATKGKLASLHDA